MRVLVGATEIGGLIEVWADAFRQHGCQVTTAVIQNNQWWPVKYDYDFTHRGLDAHRLLDTGFIFGGHDLFLYQWARRTFLPDLLDLSYLKAHGKKIITVCVGSDVRDYEAYRQWYKTCERNLRALPFPQEPVQNTLRPLRIAELYSDLLLSQPNQSILGLRPYQHFFVPLKLDEYTFNIPARAVPIIVHIPSRPELKGTSEFARALEELKKEGLKFESRMLLDIPHKTVIEELANADIVLDELNIALHGKLTIEGMASGCAVIAGNDEEYEPFPPNRPIQHAYTWNLIERLRELIQDVPYRTNLAQRAKLYVDQHHDHVKIVGRLLVDLDSNPGARIDHYPRFYLDGYKLPPADLIPKDLQDISAEQILRWGLPSGVNLRACVERGLVAPSILAHEQSLIRWNSRLAFSPSGDIAASLLA